MPQNEVKSVFVCVISADSQVVQLICPCIVTAQLPCNVISVSVCAFEDETSAL